MSRAKASDVKQAASARKLYTKSLREGTITLANAIVYDESAGGHLLSIREVEGLDGEFEKNKAGKDALYRAQCMIYLSRLRCTGGLP